MSNPTEEIPKKSTSEILSDLINLLMKEEIDENIFPEHSIYRVKESDFVYKTPTHRSPNQNAVIQKEAYDQDLDENEPLFKENAKSIYSPRNETHVTPLPRDKISSDPLPLINEVQRNKNFEYTSDVLDNLFKEEVNYFVGDIFNGAVKQDLFGEGSTKDKFYKNVINNIALLSCHFGGPIIFILACSILKEFMGRYKEKILRSKLNLIASVCFLIASKQEGVFVSTNDIVRSLNLNFSVKEVLDIEITILETINFDINIITSMDFIVYYLSYLKNTPSGFNSTEERFVYYLCCKLQCNPIIANYQPSEQAAIIMYTFMLLFNKTHLYDQNFAIWTRYPVVEILDLTLSLAYYIEDLIENDFDKSIESLIKNSVDYLRNI